MVLNKIQFRVNNQEDNIAPFQLKLIKYIFAKTWLLLSITLKCLPSGQVVILLNNISLEENYVLNWLAPLTVYKTKYKIDCEPDGMKMFIVNKVSQPAFIIYLSIYIIK